MESDNLEEYLDQRRWLLNNGLVTDDVKNQLFVYGSIVHQEIRAVEVELEADRKLVKYKLFVDPSLLVKIEQYKVLSKSTSLFGMWRFKRLLIKEGALDFPKLLENFVKDYCGPKWNVAVETLDITTYVEGFGEQGDPTAAISNLINKLTSNEDLRQELWLHYLSGNAVESFSNHLQKIQIDFYEDEKVKRALWDMLQNPPSDNLYEVLEYFTDFERNIMFLSAIDLNTEEISQIKGISEVRIKQTLASIRYNPLWEVKYGIKKESN